MRRRCEHPLGFRSSTVTAQSTHQHTIDSNNSSRSSSYLYARGQQVLRGVASSNSRGLIIQQQHTRGVQQGARGASFSSSSSSVEDPEMKWSSKAPGRRCHGPWKISGKKKKHPSAGPMRHGGAWSKELPVIFTRTATTINTRSSIPHLTTTSSKFGEIRRCIQQQRLVSKVKQSVEPPAADASSKLWSITAQRKLEAWARVLLAEARHTRTFIFGLVQQGP
ncbi:hypothetical protein LR48_Vigan26s001000 [Vigna angularis]|uniref:Uncharacterized protein n=1 Tax=Phaseolus angularis TaxID=3914 RepID=A0A0L9T2X8_PHAAN|nr:hypothetical protein LR48_Vigan26s001000 [Vigna angularis]